MPTHTTLGSLFSDIADSIRAKTGSEGIIIADNFPSEISNIETGGEIGKNLLRGTGKLTRGTGEWTNGTFRASGATFGSTWNVETINDSPVPGIVTAFTLKASGSETYPGFAQDYYPMTGHIGDKLTYSVWAKGAAGSDIILQPFWSGTAGEEESSSQTFTFTDSNWTYFEYTTQALQHDHSGLSIGYIYTHSTTKIYVTGLMLEFGEKATAWMPAKEDLINIGDSNVAAGDVLASKIFYTSNGTRTTGTIASKSSSDSTISNNVVSVPNGYYAASFTKTVGTSRTSSDLTASGATVTAPAGYYASNASKAIGSGSATTPNTTVSVTPTISVGSDAKITVSVSGTKSVTPTVSAGYVSAGAAGTITVSGSNTSQMTLRNSNSLTASGATVTAPAGYYPSAASKAIGGGTATTPATTITTNPTISINGSGVITASYSGTKSVTPSISAGYISAGTAGTITVGGSSTKSMTVQAAKTVTPSTSTQRAVASGTYCTGNVDVAAIPTTYKQFKLEQKTVNNDNNSFVKTAGGTMALNYVTVDYPGFQPDFICWAHSAELVFKGCWIRNGGGYADSFISWGTAYNFSAATGNTASGKWGSMTSGKYYIPWGNTGATGATVYVIMGKW